MRTGYLFPGQGTQSPEHRAEVETGAPELLEVAIDAIGEDPFARCGESTRFAQPAVVLASLAAWRTRDREPACAFAGHSLGELSALAAAGALTEEAAVRLAVRRGELTAQVIEARPGGMVAVLGDDRPAALRLGRENGLVLANDNAPGQIVFAGRTTGVEAVCAAARGRGLRAIELDVAGAFHSSLMQAAVEPFAATLAQVDWRPARVPVISGATVCEIRDPARDLAAALTQPVRWRQVVIELARRFAAPLVDVGPGRVLERLTRRILPEEPEHALASRG